MRPAERCSTGRKCPLQSNGDIPGARRPCPGRAEQNRHVRACESFRTVSKCRYRSNKPTTGRRTYPAEDAQSGIKLLSIPARGQRDGTSTYHRNRRATMVARGRRQCHKASSSSNSLSLHACKQKYTIDAYNVWLEGARSLLARKHAYNE
ncbi:hypothetical protein PLICRDRAFT_244925 [Plicaturopsis crispa FD-325 SS-3]|nr:hypothetical protein PLICRDRAFT_244925 [Plicaturopsis crispa FD-325 SS-3]